ncbi:MAG: hypothetical protein HY360_11385 [Verrucomicrobia bacterium]|nr:hypothetical protein [Verrucomicrobiota bacterium]
MQPLTDDPTAAPPDLCSSPIMPRMFRFGLGLVILGAWAVRMHLADMPLERDEGEYAYMAQLMLQGAPPYTEAYAMKMPGIYAAYALILSVFGATDSGIRWGLILMNAATALVIFLIGRRLACSTLADDSADRVSGDTVGLWAAATYAVSSLSPSVLGITANAEHFVVLPAMIGLFLMTIPPRGWRLFVAGVFLGVAACMKQQGFAFTLLGLFCALTRRVAPLATVKSGKRFSHAGFIAVNGALYVAGAALPVFAIALWMRACGAFDPFWFWCFDYARHYGAVWTWRDGVVHFTGQFTPVALDLLTIFGIGLLGLRKAWLRHRETFYFITGLLMAGFLATCPGLIFRPHYFIFILPGLSLAAAFGFRHVHVQAFQRCVARSSVGEGFIPSRSGRRDGPARARLFVAFDKHGVLLAQGVCFLFLLYPLAMEWRTLLASDAESACRRLYPNNAFVETRQAARQIERMTAPEERIAVLGSEPQIFFYAHRRSSIPHIYMYPLMEPQPYARRMQADLMTRLEQSPPRCLLHVRLPTSWLAHPKSEPMILEWLPRFLSEHYTRERVIPVSAPTGKMVRPEIILYQRRP